MSPATAQAALSSYRHRQMSVEVNGMDGCPLVDLQYQLRSECWATRPAWLAAQNVDRSRAVRIPRNVEVGEGLRFGDGFGGTGDRVGEGVGDGAGLGSGGVGEATGTADEVALAGGAVNPPRPRRTTTARVPTPSRVA